MAGQGPSWGSDIAEMQSDIADIADIAQTLALFPLPAVCEGGERLPWDKSGLSLPHVPSQGLKPFHGGESLP